MTKKRQRHKKITTIKKPTIEELLRYLRKRLDTIDARLEGGRDFAERTAKELHELKHQRFPVDEFMIKLTMVLRGLR